MGQKRADRIKNTLHFKADEAQTNQLAIKCIQQVDRTKIQGHIAALCLIILLPFYSKSQLNKALRLALVSSDKS